MGGDIDFYQGGYKGGVDEEAFKSFTIHNMEYWWHFREVLRASQAKSDYWKDSNNRVLPDEDQKELIGLSMLNYAVHTSLLEASIFLEQLQYELFKQVSGLRFIEVRRLWKAAYSSLYTGFNAISNIVYVLVTGQPVLGSNSQKPWNHTPAKAIKLVEGRGHNQLKEPLKAIDKKLEIRNHLDHYWAIWIHVSHRQFLRDSNFSKGYVVLDPNKEVKTKIDANQELHQTIISIAQDFNQIYRELAITNGFLDQYLQAKGWMIDYSDYGPPHNHQRPKP